ncbi:MAG TPA: ROK family protein [Trebonia sp.]
MNQQWYAGVDVGGTKIASGLVSPEGKVLGRRTDPTPARQGATAVLAAITDAIAKAAVALPADGVLAGAGVGTGGVVDHATGRVVAANSLLPGWSGMPVRERLEAALRVPVKVDNDVNVFALGEHYFGAGRGLRDVVYAAVGTGIGGAMILDGHLRRGAHHNAGEIGHWPLPEAAGRPCNCGGHGHVESVAAGPAITSWYREHGGDGAVSDLREVATRAAAGESAAVEALARGGRAFGRVLASLANVIDPEAVIVGGGVAEAGPAFWLPMAEALGAELMPAAAALILRRAALGGDAAVIGAATLLFADQIGETRADVLIERKDEAGR